MGNTKSLDSNLKFLCPLFQLFY